MAGNGNIKVNLLFQADTTSAVNNVQQLGQLLNNISTKTTIGVDSGALQQAVSSAQQLQIHLQNAVNTDTGKLDLNKLNSSLKSSGQTLSDLTGKLQAAGPAGQQAFIKVATAVASAEAPMIRVNQRLKDFGVTLANTVKWQIASTAIHGISGMLTSAVRHAEDLNSALNDIRIVTGYSQEAMAGFATRASQAAKELSTTTVEYSKAALIFYQQGLTGSQVTDRADVVIKLAQVTGQSAQQVSDQMTAIWNNFDDGKHSLEYYADALTKLGAATAASTDEIAAGLEKFAAVADTVGLSYETAAAAVATVVDKTRQSADVVGTSFKTIFARMQGLSLGETLEDGVDLNKYSEALSKVGIDVLNAKGEMRDMDDILSELGEKWEGFGETTQIAIAQTVGGVRQYNQMISLMDNWDSVQENIEKAKNATGELTKQQEIWSESYEAASKRVEQAQTNLYEKFINDKSIVKLNDIFAELINSVSRVVDSMGGVLPVVLTLVGVFSKTLFPILQAGFTSLKNNIAVLTGSASRQIANMQNMVQAEMLTMMNDAGLSETIQNQINLSKNLIRAKQQLTDASKTMSLAEQEEAQRRMQVYEAMVAEAQQALVRKAQLEEEIKLARAKLSVGDNKKALSQASAMATMQERYEGEDLTDVKTMATDYTAKELQNKQAEGAAQYQKQKADLEQQIAQLEMKKADLQSQQMVLPGFEEYSEDGDGQLSFGEDNAEINELNAEIEKLQQNMKGLQDLQEARSEELARALELQKEINKANRENPESLSVGKVEGFFADEGMMSETSVKMQQQVKTEMKGSNTESGEIEVDASIENLGRLYEMLGRFEEQATHLEAITKDIGNIDVKSEGFAEALTSMDAYEDSVREVSEAEKAYEEQLLKVKKLQDKKGSSKDKKANKELAAEKKKLKKAEEDLAAAQKKSSSVLKGSSKETGKYIKQLTSMEKAMKKAAASAGDSEDEIRDLFKALKESKDADSMTTALNNIKNKAKELGLASSDTVDGINDLAGAMKTSLLGAGLDPVALDNFINKLVELNIISPDVANKIRMAGNAGDEMASKMEAAGNRVSGAITSITSAIGSISMAVGAVQSLFSAFEEGTGPLEKVMAVMSALTMLLPIFAGAIKLTTNAQKLKTAQDWLAVAATNAQTASESKNIIVKGAAKIATVALAMAEAILNAIRQHGVVAGLVIGAVAVAAIAGMVALTSQTEKATEAEKERQQAAVDGAETANNLSSAWAEQVEAMDGLIGKYKELKDAGEDYKDVADDIIAQVPEMIDAYNEAINGLGFSDEQIASMQGILDQIDQQAALAKTAKDPAENIEKIAELQGQLDNTISEKAAEEAKKGATAAMSQTAQAIVDVGDASWEDGKVKRHVGGAGTQKRKDYGVKDSKGKTVKLNEEEAAVDILMQTFEGKRNVDRKNGYDISLDTSDSAKFLEDYEKLKAAAEEMENKLGDQLDNSDTYREVSDMLKGSQEQYEKLKEMQAEADKYGVFDAKANLEKQGLDITDIDSLKAYEDYKKKLLAEVGEDPTARATAEAWLEAQANVQEYVDAEKRIEGLGNMAGADAAAAVREMYDKELSDEEKKFFMEVDLNQYQSTEAIRAEIERLQGIADQEEIELRIGAVESAQSSLKAEGMTEEDWTNIRDNTIDWGKNGIMEFTDFLNMTYNEQQDFLQSMKETEEAALIASTKNTIAQMETNLSAVQEKLNSHQYHGGDYNAWLEQHQQYQAEADAIQENIDLLNEELAIKEKMAQQAEIEAVGLDVEEVNDYADHLMRVADNSEMLADDLSELPEVAQDVAKATMRMNRGVESLADNFEDWSDVMKKSDKSSQEYAEALSGISDAVADIADVDAKWISDDFVSNNLDLIKEAATGSAEAIDELRSKLGADIAVQITLQNGLGQEAVDEVLRLHQQLQNEIPDFQIGANVDTESFLANAQSIIDAAGMTAEQANEYFRSIGFEPTFKTEMQPVETFVPEYTTETATYPAGDYTYTYTAPDGSTQTGTVPNYRQVSKTYQSGGETMTQMMEVPALSSDGTPQIESIRKIGSGSMNNSSGSNSGGNTGGGGGGGSPKKAEPSKKSDVVDRYKEINDTIADTGREMEKANKAADRLWGPSRLAMMKKENELLEDNIEQLKQKRKEAEDNLAIDKKALEDTVGEEVGMKVEFDEGGNISNYDEIMNSLWDDLHTAETKAGEEWDDDEQAEIDAINDRISAVKAAIEQYDETNTLAKDLDKEIQDKIYEWQDNNYEQLNYELEFKLEIEDSKLEMVEYYLGKIEDDIYATAEAFGYMGQQADIYTNKLEAQGDYVAQLEKDYAAGRISLDAYKEGLKESQSATIENLQALQEQKEAMQDYYGNVMEMALEEIALYTDEMEELNSVLDHYSNILELVGKQEDYATKGKVLNAKATNLRNEMQVQQELYEKSNAEAEKWASKMATAVEGSNEYETYKKNWIAAQEAANEAQDAMLSKTEEWAEAMKAVVENELAGLAKTMEESLTGGTSFDELLTSMERRSSLQEEYLTTTNQIYETNKLMRQAQQEIDKSSNSVAKRKLQNFINETAQMQEQSELSQYELDIQQAKYDLLLAEIALEEAQSAKSTVRLQRDSEGNFGYVYTADQGAVGEAEQNLADKQNALYNIGLEGANDYSQKYAETMQEAQDAITELTEMWMNGEIESEEEFQRRKAEIQDYYYEKLKQYSNLYQVALTTDSNVIADAWSTDFNDMIYKTDDWKTAVDGYFEGAAVSMGTWADVCATVLEESGLDDVETTVGNITTKSEELKNTLIGEDGESGVVGAMMSEVKAAGELSEAYVGIQNEIDKTIAKYEELLKKINEDYTDPNTETVDPAIDPEDEKKDDTTKDEPEAEEPTTPELKVGSMVTVKKNASKWASGESIWNPVKGNNFKVKKVNGEKILIGDPSGPNYSASGITGWIKKTDLEGFATGGYTGDWEGSYGKLAMLHQKELVLNAGDTENFLAGMDLLDKIVSAIDLYSMNSQLSGALSSPSLGNMGGKDTLEQQVHIEASFPGVQDRNEIEEAFNTLINRASQYANRK